jgi:putative SOS response-associated peptidase YedK
MCGRYASHLPPEEIACLFSTVGNLPNVGPNWNVAPTDPAMAVRRHPTTGERADWPVSRAVNNVRNNGRALLEQE